LKTTTGFGRWLDLAVKDNMVEEVLETILSTAHTGHVGDGKAL
jgi:nitrogen regulatory protein PII